PTEIGSIIEGGRIAKWIVIALVKFDARSHLQEMLNRNLFETFVLQLGNIACNRLFDRLNKAFIQSASNQNRSNGFCHGKGRHDGRLLVPVKISLVQDAIVTNYQKSDRMILFKILIKRNNRFIDFYRFRNP